MGFEYKIKCALPDSREVDSMIRKLPSPIDSGAQVEIYTYAVEADGIYFVDHLVNRDIAAVALRVFIDAALGRAESVEIVQL